MIASFLQPLIPLPRDIFAAAPPAPSGAPSAGGAPTFGSLQGFAMQEQEQTEWCWAAVTASISTFFKVAAYQTQCAVATDEKGTDCCTDGSISSCNDTASLDSPLNRTGHFDHRLDSTVAFTSLSTEINNGRPFGCRIEWQGGGAHFVALLGWSQDEEGVQYLDVGDPLFDAHVHAPYNEFRTAYQGNGTWANSYFTCLAGAPPSAGGSPPSPPPTAP